MTDDPIIRTSLQFWTGGDIVDDHGTVICTMNVKELTIDQAHAYGRLLINAAIAANPPADPVINTGCCQAPAPVTLAEAAHVVREAIAGGHDPFRLAVNAASREINRDDHVASVARIAIALTAALRAIGEGEV